MSVQVSNASNELLASHLEEMSLLTSKPTFSTRDEKRHNQLLLEVSMLKKSMTPDEIRRFDQERLLKAAGLPKLPERARSKMDHETDREWRRFGLGQDVRTSYLPKDSEVRSNEAGTQSITYTELLPGGAFVPGGGFVDRLYSTKKAYDQIYDDAYCNIVETDTGASVAFPIWDDVASASVQVSETAASQEVDVANFGTKQLGAYTFRSGIVGVSLELMQDSNFPLGIVLERVFAFRHARGGGAALVSGSGVNSPTGLITGALGAGCPVIVASGSSTNDGGAETGSTSLGTQDLSRAYFSLNAAYRPGACWAMNDTTLLYLTELLDKNGRPIISFRRSATDVDADCPYLLGKPCAICPSMPTMGASTNSVVFYNPLYWIQRRVISSNYVRRFTQSVSLATFGLVGFQSYLRMDSGLVAPNSSYVPAVVIQNHS